MRVANWSEVPQAALLLLAAGIATLLGSYARRRRQVPGANSLAVMCLGIAVWTAAAAVYFFLASPNAQSALEVLQACPDLCLALKTGSPTPTEVRVQEGPLSRCLEIRVATLAGPAGKAIG